jgi:integrase-like protein
LESRHRTAYARARLRHAFAVELVRSGAPLYVVRDALGHSSIATTNVYLSRAGAHEAVDAMRNVNGVRPESATLSRDDADRVVGLSTCLKRLRMRKTRSDKIECVPIYELRIKRAAHVDPEEHIFDSGDTIYRSYENFDFNGERLRVVESRSETLENTSEGTLVVRGLTCVPLDSPRGN